MIPLSLIIDWSLQALLVLTLTIDTILNRRVYKGLQNQNEEILEQNDLLKKNIDLLTKQNAMVKAMKLISHKKQESESEK